MGQDRRLGIVLIVVAALALVLVNRVSGRDVQGEAAAPPPIPPPAVGACIDSTGTVPVEVPCTQSHTGEVIESWAAGDQPETSNPDQPGGACMIGYRQFASSKPGWAPPPVQVRRIDVSVGGPIGWAGCLQAPAPAGNATSEQIRYAGRLLDQDSVADYPPQLRSCFVGADAGSLGSPYPVSCDSPHMWELLAVAVSGEPPAASCAEFARSIVGSDTPFNGDHALTTAAMPQVFSSTMTFSVDDPTNTSSVTVAHFGTDPRNCAVRAPEGKQLVGSVVGLGNNPVPFG